MRWMRASLLLALCFVIGLYTSANAKDANSPDPSSNPALAALIKSGAKFFYMGRNAGLDGWLAVKDGQIQIIYKPTNNAYVLVGYLFGPNGDNLTSAQVKELTATNKELAALASVDTTNDLPAAKPATPSLISGVTTTAEPDKASTDVFLPAGERLMNDMDKASGVTLGTNDKAPQIYVVLSPGCSACKDFWQGLHDPVEKGLIRLRFFPVGPANSDYERTSAQLLHAADPFSAWDKFTNGDKTVLAGTPLTAFVDQVKNNTALVERWKLPAIPYLLYRDKDGHVKVVQGAPQNPQVLLDDVVAAKPEVPKPEIAKPEVAKP